ncbi:MAG: flagellar export protein FliJ [Planctomycetota bacterium]
MAEDGFQFKYQKILEVREHQEKQLEIELARIDESIRMQRQERRRWEGVRDELLEALGRARRRGDMVEAAQCSDYLRHVRERIEHFKNVEAEMKKEREQVRSSLEDVLRSRKVLENYRDRLRGEFRSEREKAEEKVLDLHSTHKFTQAEGDR